MSSGIYKIKNIVTGMFYIGQAKDVKNRKSSHFYKLKRGKHENNKLQNSFNKHGSENFIFEIVEFGTDDYDKEKLTNREQYYIDLYGLKNLYNLNPKANPGNSTPWTPERRALQIPKSTGEKNPFFGKTHTEEVKAKISESKRGNKNCLGVPKSPEHREKIGLYRRGKSLPREQVEKRAKTLKARPLVDFFCTWCKTTVKTQFNGANKKFCSKRCKQNARYELRRKYIRAKQRSKQTL